MGDTTEHTVNSTDDQSFLRRLHVRSFIMTLILLLDSLVNWSAQAA